MPGGGRQPRGATQAHLPGDTPGETRSQGDTEQAGRRRLGGPSGHAVDARHVVLQNSRH